MEYLITFQEFIDRLEKSQDDKKAEAVLKRFNELAGLTQSDIFANSYAIKITIEKPTGFLLEHDQYTRFKGTTNRYTFHPENSDIPVQAHYHIVPLKSKKELYAVNVGDGKAHHKRNRGYVIPKKEANELRDLGVKIPPDNILESRKLSLSENIEENNLTLFIIIDEEG